MSSAASWLPTVRRMRARVGAWKSDVQLLEHGGGIEGGRLDRGHALAPLARWARSCSCREMISRPASAAAMGPCGAALPSSLCSRAMAANCSGVASPET